MAYTRVYSIVNPAGSQLAKNIDDEIRDARADWKERMLTLLKTGTTIDDDPLVLNEKYTGEHVGKQLCLSYAAFNSNTSGKETYYDDEKLIAFTDTGPLVASFSLPPGVILQKVELLCDKQQAGSIIWKVRWRSFGPGSTGTLDNRTTTTVGLHVSSTTITPLKTITGDDITWIEVDSTGTAGNAFWVYGARLTYDSPADSRVTI